jgi:hypothetical protein
MIRRYLCVDGFCCMSFRWLLTAALGVFSSTVFAWSDHASLVWPLVRSMPELLLPTLEVESLDEFLAAEATGLESALSEHEAWARENLPHYAPRPDNLAFTADAQDLRAAFLSAIRVNPTLDYPLYRQSTVEDPPVALVQRRAFDDLSFLKGGVSHDAIVYLSLMPGDLVAPAHVVASGSDEPDFGMDIGLFADNATEFGRQYGFGDQPFGNPNLDYSSQAPFHMGFYHLDWITRRAQPDLLRTYPQWRVSLYRLLADLAFASGHDYWGWRFTGWGLHYIGDLTQPYHAQPLPGISTAAALWSVVTGKTAAAVQLVSNRHGVLESYQYQRVQRALDQRDWTNPMLAAIASGAPVPEFDNTTVRGALTVESVKAGAGLDAALEDNMPARFVSDPDFEWTGSGEESNIVVTVRKAKGEGAVTALDAAVTEQMQRFSRFARAWINDALRNVSQSKTTKGAKQ